MIDNTSAATPSSTARATPLANKPVLLRAGPVFGPKFAGAAEHSQVGLAAAEGRFPAVGRRTQADRASFRSFVQRKGFRNHAAAAVVKALPAALTVRTAAPYSQRDPPTSRKDVWQSG